MRKIIQSGISAGYCFLLFNILTISAIAQNPNVKIRSIASISGLTEAMQIAHAGDNSNRIFIAERNGLIKVFQPEALGTSATFLNMNSGGQVVYPVGEGGLLSIVFHPNYETNGYLYTYYTDQAGDLVVARYTATTPAGNEALASTRLEILKIEHQLADNHNGGEMHFGNDGYLYLSTGDGGLANDPNGNAQNPASLLGKILRMNVDVPASATQFYSVPPGNPDPASIVYAKGLRNPFRWSFDRLTNAMWIGDVGQDAREEINYVPATEIANANFGWRCYEGNIETPGVSRTGCPNAADCIAPAYTYTIGTPASSVVGGIVYRGNASSVMYGYYIATDYFSGRIYKIKADGTPEIFQTSGVTGIVDIGEDETGEIYAVTAGAVYSIYATEALPVKLVDFSGAPGVEGVKLSWNTSSEENSASFDVEYSLNASNFEKIGTVPSQNALSGYSYSFSHAIAQKGKIYYRLKMIDTDESFEYSRIIYVENKGGDISDNFVRPSLITNNTMNLILDEPFTHVELIGTGGQVFLKQEISGKSGPVSIPIKNATSGIYIVRLSDNHRVVQQKVLLMD